MELLSLAIGSFLLMIGFLAIPISRYAGLLLMTAGIFLYLPMLQDDEASVRPLEESTTEEAPVHSLDELTLESAELHFRKE